MKDRVKVLLMMIILAPIVLTVIGVVILTLANDLFWLEGWIFIILVVGYIFLYMGYFLIKDPAAMLKRTQYIDPETKFIPDKTFMVLALPILFFIIFVPGIEHWLLIRFNFSLIPFLVPFRLIYEIPGFIGLILSGLFVMYVNRVNRYASKGLVVHKDHELITSGPYRYIRHPMYVGIIIFLISLPLALGSLITTAVSLLFMLLIIYRIGIEEKMLVDHLPGYKEYMEKVRHRIIPKIY